jgi:hypothetical protein
MLNSHIVINVYLMGKRKRAKAGDVPQKSSPIPKNRLKMHQRLTTALLIKFKLKDQHR